ncbi:MAG: HAD family phosphatase, partial [Thermodesulfovibrionia bacterium]|nr:HAD family phosphatase [Thermodesulfovibrionia bacterium]
MIKAVIFDFGGVLAKEGFKEGLKSIGEQNGLAPEDFFKTAEELIYKTGYVTGKVKESIYWNALRNMTGIIGSDKEFRKEIIKRFLLRTKLLKFVEKLKTSGFITAILSDQTNWLEEMNQRTPFYHHFDYVFNSYTLHKGKKDPSVFGDVCSVMGFSPEEVIFIDDNSENIERARSKGLNNIHFQDMKNFEEEIQKYISTDIF